LPHHSLQSVTVLAYIITYFVLQLDELEKTLDQSTSEPYKLDLGRHSNLTVQGNNQTNDVCPESYDHQDLSTGYPFFYTGMVYIPLVLFVQNPSNVGYCTHKKIDKISIYMPLRYQSTKVCNF